MPTNIVTLIEQRICLGFSYVVNYSPLLLLPLFWGLEALLSKHNTSHSHRGAMQSSLDFSKLLQLSMVPKRFSLYLLEMLFYAFHEKYTNDFCILSTESHGKHLTLWPFTYL